MLRDLIYPIRGREVSKCHDVVILRCCSGIVVLQQIVARRQLFKQGMACLKSRRARIDHSSNWMGRSWCKSVVWHSGDLHSTQRAKVSVSSGQPPLGEVHIEVYLFLPVRVYGGPVPQYSCLRKECPVVTDTHARGMKSHTSCQTQYQCYVDCQCQTHACKLVECCPIMTDRYRESVEGCITCHLLYARPVLWCPVVTDSFAWCTHSTLSYVQSSGMLQHWLMFNAKLSQARDTELVWYILNLTSRAEEHSYNWLKEYT